MGSSLDAFHSSASRGQPQHHAPITYPDRLHGGEGFYAACLLRMYFIQEYRMVI